MTRIAIVIAASLALSACSFGSAGGVENIPAIPTSPSAVADSTVKDEQGILGVELGYKAARLLAEAGVDAGWIRGADAAQAQVLNRKAKAAVEKARTAYRTLNAASYRAAVDEARGEVEKLLGLAQR